MDLTGKQIRITNTATNAMPASTVIFVDVMQEVAPGARQVVASYELHFDEMYGGPSDGALIAAINEKLSAL